MAGMAVVARSRDFLVVATKFFEGHYKEGALHRSSDASALAPAPALTLTADCAINAIRAVYHYEGDPSFKETAASLIQRAYFSAPLVLLWYERGELHCDYGPAIRCGRFWAMYVRGRMQFPPGARYAPGKPYSLARTLHELEADGLRKFPHRSSSLAKKKHMYARANIADKVPVVFYESLTRSSRFFALVADVARWEIFAIVKVFAVYCVKESTIADTIEYQ